MAETSVLQTQAVRCKITQPGVNRIRRKWFGADIVTGMQLPCTDFLNFTYFDSQPSAPETLQQISLSQDVAERVYDFSERVYVSGQGQFDCHGFLAYAMGWTQDIMSGTHFNYYGKYVNHEETRSSQAYVVAQREGGRPPHSVLGVDLAGKSLGAQAYEGPLMLADNADLLKASGGFAVLEVSHLEKIH